jgi:hypothetical protein
MKHILLIAASCLVQPLVAATYHVDIDSLGGPASDANPGTAEKPWKSAMKACTTAKPGDTVMFRRGVHRLPRTVLTADLTLDASRAEPITFKASPGEEVIITVLKPIPADAWQQIATTKSGGLIYAAPSGEDGRVTNLTEGGVPLTRAPTDDPRYPHRDTLPEAITQPGEWASSLRDHVFRHITGPASVAVFLESEDCRFEGNRITDCDVDGLISFEGARERNVRAQVSDNILKSNRVRGAAASDSP